MNFHPNQTWFRRAMQVNFTRQSTVTRAIMMVGEELSKEKDRSELILLEELVDRVEKITGHRFDGMYLLKAASIWKSTQCFVEETQYEDNNTRH